MKLAYRFLSTILGAKRSFFTHLGGQMKRRTLEILALITLALLLVDQSAQAAPTCQFGVDQCKFGFVWREAFSGDHACVSGASRNQALSDNNDSPNRKEPNSDNCKLGWVWREANTADHVCVTGTVRNTTKQENALAASRIDPNCTAKAICTNDCKSEKAECLAAHDRHRNCGREYSECIKKCNAVTSPL